MDAWIFLALPGAGVVHILEEYVYPGGFRNGLNRLVPRASHLFTSRFHLIVNGLFLLLCLLSTVIGKANLVLSTSAFSLIFANAVLHIRGAIVTKGYYPGVVSGAVIYIPLSVYAYSMFLSSGQMTWLQAGLSALIGISYMAALMVYVLSRQVRKTDG